MFKKITLAVLAGLILAAPGDSFGQRGGGGRGNTGGRGGFAGFNRQNRQTTSEASSIVVGTDEAEITLIPYPEKNWIIARAPAEVLKQIEEWIIKLDLKEIFLEINTAIPCGLIINELVSNSLKHAFSSETSGEIFIKMRREKSPVLLRYREM